MTCAGGEGFAGAINFHPSGEFPAVDLTGRVHLLPCSIKQDGPCPVSHYFKPRKTDAMVDDLCVEEAFFRGRKLEGVTIPLPQGYRGYVLDKKRSGSEKCSETPGGGFGRWVSRAEFTNLTYWNHDNLPSSDDLLPRCFHWFPVANAVFVICTLSTMVLFDMGTYIATHPLVANAFTCRDSSFLPMQLHKPVTEEELASATSVQTTAQK